MQSRAARRCSNRNGAWVPDMHLQEERREHERLRELHASRRFRRQRVFTLGPREKPARFHVVPRKGWDVFLRRMACEAANDSDWCGGETSLPLPGRETCWLLPATDEMALSLSQLQKPLENVGWRLLTCDAALIAKLSNKVLLHAHALSRGLQSHLPLQFTLS